MHDATADAAVRFRNGIWLGGAMPRRDLARAASPAGARRRVCRDGGILEAPAAAGQHEYCASVRVILRGIHSYRRSKVIHGRAVGPTPDAAGLPRRVAIEIKSFLLFTPVLILQREGQYGLTWIAA